MLPARQVSGDFYDFFLIDENRLGLAIGDVSGKGIPAALFMAVSRTLLRATALQGVSPKDCLDHVNRVLLKQTDGEVFLTLMYGVFDLKTGDFHFSVGGQPPPYLCSPEGAGGFLREPRGMMLGLIERAEYRCGTVNVSPGETLVFYTDGVTEAESADQQFYTERRLAAILEKNVELSPKALTEGLLEDLRTFTSGTEQADDITILAMRRL